MRHLLSLMLATLLAGPALGATATVTIPPSAVPRVLELCEILRINLQIAKSNWTMDDCANELLRRELRRFHMAVRASEQRQAATTSKQQAADEYDADHFSSAMLAFCGDGKLDTEFGEECDDANNDNGDGCDADCKTEL